MTKKKNIYKLFKLGEELLKRIRERHGKPTKNESDETSTRLLIPPV